MSKIAVVAHSGKSLGDGLEALRDALSSFGAVDVDWREVDKSKNAPKAARAAADAGADLIFVWGGDGTVQRCIDALVGSDVVIAILPAGTANLLATNLGIPLDVERAVDIGLHGEQRQLDVGKMNGEHFAVMAGVGFDAQMIADANAYLKKRLGRAAYIVTGAKNLRSLRTRTHIEVDGEPWFDGFSSCVLMGNVGALFGGVSVFEDAHPDDGLLEVGVVTADGAWEWLRALARASAGNAKKSPFVRTTKRRKIRIKLATAMKYELDGGARPRAHTLKIRTVPQAITVAVPMSDRP